VVPFVGRPLRAHLLQDTQRQQHPRTPCRSASLRLLRGFRGFGEVHPAAGQGPGVGSRQGDTAADARRSFWLIRAPRHGAQRNDLGVGFDYQAAVDNAPPTYPRTDDSDSSSCPARRPARLFIERTPFVRLCFAQPLSVLSWC
jgi:hypothetical protein